MTHSSSTTIRNRQHPIAQERRHIVAVAVRPLLETHSNLFAFELLSGAIALAMHQAGVEVREWGGLPGPGFVVCSCHVGDRPAALGAIKEAVARMGLLPRAQIAWYHDPEDCWLTVLPEGAEPFDRFLTPANFAWARRMIEKEGRTFLAVELHRANFRSEHSQGGEP